MSSITVLTFVFLQICRSLTMNGVSYPAIYFKRMKRDHFSIAGSDGRIQEASSGTNAANPWFYKFPPWFFPINPPPDGFISIDGRRNNIGIVDDNVAEESSSSLENSVDGDVIIMSDFVKNDRQGRLLNVKVPGDTIYRDEVVKTIVDFSLGKFPKVKYRPGNDGVILDQPPQLTKEPDVPGVVIQNGISIQDLTPSIGTNDRPHVQQLFPLQTTNRPSQLPKFQKNLVNFNQNTAFGVTKPLNGNRNIFSNQNNAFAINQHVNSNRNPIPNKTNGIVINQITSNIRNQTPKPEDVFVVNQAHSNNKNTLPGNIRITSQFVNQKPVSQSFTSNKGPNIGNFRPSPPDTSLNSIKPQFNLGSFQSSNYYGFQPSSIPLAGIFGATPPAYKVSQLKSPQVHTGTPQLKTHTVVTNPTPYTQHTLRGTLRVTQNHNPRQQGVTSTYGVKAQQGGGSNIKVRVPGAFPPVQQGIRGSVSTVRQRPNSFRQAKPQQVYNTHNGRQRVRYHNNRPQGLFSQRGQTQFTVRRPTSIQDIIRSNHDNSPASKSRERGNGVSPYVITSRPSRYRPNPVTQRNNWRWPTLS